MTSNGGELIMGDNPFHGISHLSQERARSRFGNDASDEDRADLVWSALGCGAEGFMFSVSDTTLGVVKAMRQKKSLDQIKLYAIVPYTFEYVRIATQLGTPGLAERFAKQIAGSGDVGAVFNGLAFFTRTNPSSLLKTYLAYELSRLKSATGGKAKLSSLFLHEVITDMSLALDLKWVFETHIDYLTKHNITPGFHTRNLPFLVDKFERWGLNLNQLLLVTPLNKVGFQMKPSREACEESLRKLPAANVLAISVLACGYLTPLQAVDYIASLSNLKGVVAGASTQQQACEVFKLFKERLSG